MQNSGGGGGGKKMAGRDNIAGARKREKRAATAAAAAAVAYRFTASGPRQFVRVHVSLSACVQSGRLHIIAVHLNIRVAWQPRPVAVVVATARGGHTRTGHIDHCMRCRL